VSCGGGQRRPRPRWNGWPQSSCFLSVIDAEGSDSRLRGTAASVFAVRAEEVLCRTRPGCEGRGPLRRVLRAIEQGDPERGRGCSGDECGRKLETSSSITLRDGRIRAPPSDADGAARRNGAITELSSPVRSPARDVCMATRLQPSQSPRSRGMKSSNFSSASAVSMRASAAPRQRESRSKAEVLRFVLGLRSDVEFVGIGPRHAIPVGRAVDQKHRITRRNRDPCRQIS